MEKYLAVCLSEYISLTTGLIKTFVTTEKK